MNGWSLVRVFDQALSNEVNAVLGAVLEYFLFELRLFAEDGGVKAQTCLAGETEGCRASQHLVSENTHGKNISFLCYQGHIDRVRLG